MLLIARIVRLVAGVVVGLIAIGIALVVLGANQDNSIVSTLVDWARWLTQPFHDVFTVDSSKWNTALNWGLAALVYAAVAALIVRLLVWAGAGVGPRRRYFRRSDPVA
jgi:hypothetical protein